MTQKHFDTAEKLLRQGNLLEAILLLNRIGLDGGLILCHVAESGQAGAKDLQNHSVDCIDPRWRTER